MAETRCLIYYEVEEVCAVENLITLRTEVLILFRLWTETWSHDKLFIVETS